MFKVLYKYSENEGYRVSEFDTLEEAQEEAQEEIETTYIGDDIDIGFNVTYLLDVLTNVKNSEIKISIGDSNSSALITIPENDNFKYVVMPMRI